MMVSTWEPLLASTANADAVSAVYDYARRGEHYAPSPGEIATDAAQNARAQAARLEQCKRVRLYVVARERGELHD